MPVGLTIARHRAIIAGMTTKDCRCCGTKLHDASSEFCRDCQDNYCDYDGGEAEYNRLEDQRIKLSQGEYR